MTFLYDLTIGLVRGLARLLILAPLRGLRSLAVTLAHPLARMLSGIALIVAAVALAHDLGSVTIGRPQDFKATTMMAHWQDLAPQSSKAARTFTTQRLQPWVWSAISAVLSLPTFIAFTILSLVLAFAGRRRRHVEIFAN